jgi:hypothetical protein
MAGRKTFTWLNFGSQVTCRLCRRSEAVAQFAGLALQDTCLGRQVKVSSGLERTKLHAD